MLPTLITGRFPLFLRYQQEVNISVTVLSNTMSSSPTEPSLSPVTKLFLHQTASATVADLSLLCKAPVVLLLATTHCRACAEGEVTAFPSDAAKRPIP